mmetsp:Transcript_4993/g.11650  ORF Transcript_4993/g.11650 Transcript_4993/m.11650 type:complete len:434 (+) Transcript_4993:3-1304(+)
MTLPKPWPSTPWHRLPSGHSLDNLDYRHHAEQSFVVMRHAERADSWGQDDWFKTKDFQRWPMDPPLAPEGLEMARETGSQIAYKLGGVDGGADGCERPFTIVSSPFFRCVQTAVELARAPEWGASRPRILLDNQLGEVFSRDVFGDDEPAGGGTRDAEEIVAYCKRHGVELEGQRVGERPRWPEDLPSARCRLLCRFLRYLEQGHTLKKNFALVTHCDGVTAAMSAMPSMSDVSVAKVHYCGYFLGIAKSQDAQITALGSDLPLQASLTSDSESASGQVSQVSAMPQTSRAKGWALQHSGVELQSSESEALTPRIRRWSTKSNLKEEHIRELLRCGSRGVASICSTGVSSTCVASTASDSTAFSCDSPKLLRTRSAIEERQPETLAEELPIVAASAEGSVFRGRLLAVKASSLMLRRNANARHTRSISRTLWH